jgi:hypothetical protein
LAGALTNNVTFCISTCCHNLLLIIYELTKKIKTIVVQTMSKLILYACIPILNP